MEKVLRLSIPFGEAEEWMRLLAVITERAAVFRRMWLARTPIRRAIFQANDSTVGRGMNEDRKLPGNILSQSHQNLIVEEQIMAESLSQDEIFDSLPYYDDDLQKFPILKQKVEQELARQPKPPSTLHPRVPPPFELFSVREHE